MEALSDDDLAHRTVVFSERLDNGETLDDLLIDAFATVREAAWRVLGQRHFDVQLMGGMALHFGWIAEMKTGEGKTLVSTLPVYLNALSGKGMHVITVNDYLAAPRRRVDGPGPPLPRADRGPGQPRASPTSRTSGAPTPATSPTAPTPSSASTTCATTWPGRAKHMVQRGHVYAIVDEVDSILIDEARTPLIISGPASESAKLYYQFAGMARTLTARRGLRGRRGEAHRRPHRGGHRQGRAPGRRGQHVRPGVGQLRPPPDPGPAGQGALPPGQGLPGRRGRGEDRRRVHGPHPRGPALVRRPAPGRRGQGAGADQRGEPHLGHGHPPELLPPLREARRA